MAGAKSFQDLIVWQKSHSFVLKVYQITAKFPADERFGLISQFRRAAVSIPANIAEGFRKTGKADKLRFYNISQGSLEECRYYILLASDLGFADVSELEVLIEEVSKLLNAYTRSIRSS